MPWHINWCVLRHSTYRCHISSVVTPKVFIVILNIKPQTEEDVVPDEHLHSEMKPQRQWMIPWCFFCGRQLYLVYNGSLIINTRKIFHRGMMRIGKVSWNKQVLGLGIAAQKTYCDILQYKKRYCNIYKLNLKILLGHFWQLIPPKTSFCCL